jgi:hypothetical protein
MPKLPLRKIFNYILKLLYLGCQSKTLPIDKDPAGRPEIHPTSVYVFSGAGQPMVVWTPYCSDRSANCMRTCSSIRQSFTAMARQRPRKKVATTSASAATNT